MEKKPTDFEQPSGSRTLSLPEAQDHVRQILRASRENFVVASLLLPRHLRDPFAAVYAYCRVADDLADEQSARPAFGADSGDGDALSRLADWRLQLGACFAGEARHPVFIALQPVIKQFDLPQEPFSDLLDAFTQDQTVKRYGSWPQLLDYCRCSADPVGRLVLRLFGAYTPEHAALSDATCTALQLTNFWQDIRRDVLERNRIYLPAEIAEAAGLDLELMAKLIKLDEATSCASCGLTARATGPSALAAVQPAARRAVAEAVRRTWPLFAQGRELWPKVPRAVRPDLRLFTLGGEAILRRVAAQRYDTLTQRPRLGRATRLRLLVGVLAHHALRR